MFGSSRVLHESELAGSFLTSFFTCSKKRHLDVISILQFGALRCAIGLIFPLPVLQALAGCIMCCDDIISCTVLSEREETVYESSPNILRSLHKSDLVS